ncbi:NB-ARC domain-containing protein [Planktothrix agardhii]|uniref:NB-ARC domain-containing protein n=1 Tax=Planktothrix agardhii TaxID=1160 RepID=UPI0020B1A5DF|nr:ATP-binding protein [Planktothrix agardhii]CAD5949884.1 putative WD repeat-containing protein alr2800 [Planktothrix agardhii]
MDVQEVLRLADHLVFTKTGKHLDDLQEAILRGSLENEKYSKVADEFHCSEGHVKDIASDLWKILSDTLGEEVRKYNLRSTLNRQKYSNVLLNFGKDYVQINNINVCHKSPLSSDNLATPKNNKNEPLLRVNLDDAPDIYEFFGRTEELETLTDWILKQRCRVVMLLGMSGIGKTALAVKLVQEIQENFDVVIWQSLDTAPALNELLINLLQFLLDESASQLPINLNEQLSELMKVLRSQRCLIILDDFQTLFNSGQLAGNYRPNFENYRLFIKKISQLNHQSCVILNSWELPKDLIESRGKNTAIHYLLLSGLGESAKDLLKAQGLSNIENWNTLLDYYGGNPYFLNSISTVIKNLFGGKVSDFLDYETLFLGEDLTESLTQQFNRLSELEQKIIIHLGQIPNGIMLSEFQSNLKISHSDVLKALASLGQRCWIERLELDNKTYFTLQPMLKYYIASLNEL